MGTLSRSRLTIPSGGLERHLEINRVNLEKSYLKTGSYCRNGHINRVKLTNLGGGLERHLILIALPRAILLSNKEVDYKNFIF